MTAKPVWILKQGWGTSTTPDLCVQSLLSKSKDAKTSITTALVASKIRDVDLFKGNYRSPYERNIVQQFGLLENLNDFIFSEIGVVNSKVDHPLIITEPIANPEYCRQNILEQYFECYEVFKYLQKKQNKKLPSNPLFLFLKLDSFCDDRSGCLVCDV